MRFGSSCAAVTGYDFPKTPVLVPGFVPDTGVKAGTRMRNPNKANVYERLQGIPRMPEARIFARVALIRSRACARGRQNFIATMKKWGIGPRTRLELVTGN